MKSHNVKDLLLSKLFSRREIEDLGSLMHRIPLRGREESVVWTLDLVDWLRQPLNVSEELKLPWTEFRLKDLRLRFLIEFLEANQSIRQDVQNLFLRLFKETNFMGLFIITPHDDHGIFYSTFARLVRKVLPIYRHDDDMGEIVVFLFPRPDDVEVLNGMSSDLKTRLVNCLFGEAFSSPDLQLKLRGEIRGAMIYLTQLALSLRLKGDIMRRWPLGNFEKDALSQSLKILLSQEVLDEVTLEELEKGLLDSRSHLNDLYRKLEQQGISMTLVLYLERLQKKLNRLRRLERLQRSLNDLPGGLRTEERVSYSFNLFVELIEHGQDKRSLRALLRQNLALLARKIVDRTSVTGEHYLVRTAREYRLMWQAAAGGGLVTFVTVLIKMYSGGFKWPLFSEGIISWANYAGSFLLMQILHLTLATKQPSMTASALAEKMVHLEDEQEIDGFVAQLAQITRAQFIAAVGNIGAIIPAAWLFHEGFVRITGYPMMSAEAATYQVEHLHPFAGPTLFFAAFTGILLFLSSLVAGWVENFFIFTETPQALRQNLLIRKSLGDAFAQRLAHLVEKHAGPAAGNISLGFLLAFTAVFAKFFGLPLEVRHVTLSSGTLMLALLDHPSPTLELHVTLWVGIGLIGILNFGVSFLCSFAMATRARSVNGQLQRRLFRRSFARFLKNPFYFLLPL